MKLSGLIVIALLLLAFYASSQQSVSAAVPSSAAPFDYALSVSPSGASIVTGSSVTATITATLISGMAQPVTLSGSISPQPNACQYATCVCQNVNWESTCGTVTMSPPSITPTSTGAISTLTFSTTTIVPPGTFKLNITGSPSGQSSSSAIYTLNVTRPGPVKTSVNVHCGSTVAVGGSSLCIATVRGTQYPGGGIVFSAVGSNGGRVLLAPYYCTLDSNSCYSEVKLRALSPGTVIIIADYSGDSNNLPSSDSAIMTVERSANVFAADAASPTVLGGKVSSDQTSVTGVSVTITDSIASDGSIAADGTSVTMLTQHLNGPGYHVDRVSLNNAAYYDVLVIGLRDGVANVCVTDRSAGSATTMRYWNGTAWLSASGGSVPGSKVCGAISVSDLKEYVANIANLTNVAVGDASYLAQPFFTAIAILMGAIVAAAVAVGIFVRSRSRKRTQNTQETSIETLSRFLRYLNRSSSKVI